MSYIIKVWETEQLRDIGESIIINSGLNILQEAIEEAKSIMKDEQFASLEVQDDAEEKSFYFCTPQEEKYIYNDILRDDESVKKIQEVIELYFIEKDITNMMYYGSDKETSMLSISKIYMDILKKLDIKFNNIVTDEISDGKYRTFVKLNQEINVRIDTSAFNGIDVIVHNIESIKNEYDIVKNKQKLKQFFSHIDNEKMQTVNNTIQKFKEIFKNEYFKDDYSIREAYFDYKKISYYIKNGNGITFEIISGKGDIFGDQHTHNGIDLRISSKLSKDERVREGINIFCESEYCKESLLDKFEKFFDIDLSEKSLKENEDNNIYKTLTSNAKNSTDIVKTRYEQLKLNSELQHDEEVDYDMISPYGGLDVEIHSVPELLYEKILKYQEDEYFFEKAITLFGNNYGEYVEQEIEECKYALYIIEHKNEYKEILDTEYELLIHNDFTPHKDIDEILKDKEEIENELKNLRKEYKLLSTKKHSLFDVVLGTKKNEQQRMLELYNPQIEEGLIVNCEKKLINNKLEKREYDEYIEEYEKLENRIKELKEKVEKPFKNFTLNEDLYSYPLDNGDYFLSKSLEKLIEQEKYYKDRLIGLEKIADISERNKDIIEEIGVEKIEEIEEMET